MNTKRQVKCTGIAYTLVSIYLISQLNAEERAPGVSPAAEIETIIVTARKKAEDLQNAPIAMTAITAEAINNYGLTDAAQFEQYSPNLTFDFTAPISGSSNAASVYIRGVGQSDFLLTVDPGVGVYADGVYIARSVGGVLDLLDVERVEILRGPQGTLFGRNTIGGAINVISTRPGNELTGEFKVRVGELNRRDYQAMINLPLIEDTLATRIAVSSLNRDGYMKRIAAGDKLGNENKDTARVRTRWLPSENVELDVAADYTRGREQTAAIAIGWTDDPALHGVGALTNLYNEFVAPANSVPGFGEGVTYGSHFLTADPLQTYGTGPNRSDYDILGLSVTAQIQWEHVTAKSISGFRDMDSTFGRDPDGSPLVIVHTFNEYEHSQFSQEFQLSGSALRERLDWHAGIYYLYEDGKDVITAPLVEGVFEAIGVPFSVEGTTDIENENTALYLHGTYAFNSRLSASAGLRYTYETKQADIDFLYSDIGAPYIEDPTGKEDFESLSPRVSLEYQARDDLMLYTSYTNGFKSGGFTGRYVIPTDKLLPFDPEELDTFEVGLKSEWLEHRLRVNAAAFYSEYQDIQVLIFDGIAPQTRNAARGKISGFDLELTALPSPALHLNLGVGYLDAKYTALDHAAGEAASLVNPLTLSHKFVNTPEWSINFALDYALGEFDIGRLNLITDISYRTEVFNDAINTPELRQDEQVLINARLAYESPQQDWRASIYVRNLTDETRIVSGAADKATFGTVAVVYGEPRQAGIELVYRY